MLGTDKAWAKWGALLLLVVMLFPSAFASDINLTQNQTALAEQVYYGTLNLFSATLRPFFVLILGIICALVIIGFGMIISKIARMIGS